MPSDDYTAVTGGGLKLKGVAGSKVDKKKKKKRPKDSNPATEGESAANEKRIEAHEEGQGTSVKEQALDRALAEEDGKVGDDGDDGGKRDWSAGKTEAERRHEERRRKMLDERLKREGVKTHKERVEELNRYLSNLSEHHDMPRIGPG